MDRLDVLPSGGGVRVTYGAEVTTAGPGMPIR